jgi:hypothetical protein
LDPRLKKAPRVRQGALANTHNYIERIFIYRSGSIAMNRLTRTDRQSAIA